MNPFLQLPAEKKDSKNDATRNFLGPSYFDPTLVSRSIRNTMHKKFALVVECRVSAAKIYLYHSTEIAKARPHSEGIF